MLSIIMFGVGFVSGMYVSSQLEKSIDKNIVNETIKEELDGRKEMDRQDDRDSDPPLTKEEKELIKKIK